jgi:hypothetical protein
MRQEHTERQMARRGGNFNRLRIKRLENVEILGVSESAEEFNFFPAQEKKITAPYFIVRALPDRELN